MSDVMEQYAQYLFCILKAESGDEDFVMRYPEFKAKTEILANEWDLSVTTIRGKPMSDTIQWDRNAMPDIIYNRLCTYYAKGTVFSLVHREGKYDPIPIANFTKKIKHITSLNIIVAIIMDRVYFNTEPNLFGKWWSEKNEEIEHRWMPPHE